MDPYLQLVDDGACEHTGLQLKDIWRYFRYTWVSPSKTVPGRNVWFLVRDAAAKNHPIIGIGALGSAIVQLGVRDRWIGWNGDQFIRLLQATADDGWAEWLEQAIARQLDGIYIADFVEDRTISKADLRQPSLELVARLTKLAVEAREQHRLYPKAAEHKNGRKVDWEKRARTYLFRSKRAAALADLLSAKLRLAEAGFTSPTAPCLHEALRRADGKKAVKRVLRRVKASRGYQHAGHHRLRRSGPVRPRARREAGLDVDVLTRSGRRV